MSGKLRVGILGAGAFASRRHLPDLLADPRAEVTAACRRDPEALAVFADYFGIPLRFGDWREMLNKTELDAVVIATPHDQHADQARAALERGLHVLLEKPMALTASDARSLRDIARSRGLTLCVAYNPPYWQHTRALRESVLSGRLGELEAVTITATGNVDAVFGDAPLTRAPGAVVTPTLFRADPVQNGGGYFMDGGGHLLSELLWVTGKRAISVSAKMDRMPGDRRAVLSVELEGGLIVAICAVGNSRHSERRMRSVYDGASGSVAVTGQPFRLTWSGMDGPDERTDEPVPTPVGDWLTCIATGAEPAGSAEHATQVTELLEAAYRSAFTGCAAALSGG